jgi:gliding motility-associated-like protein
MPFVFTLPAYGQEMYIAPNTNLFIHSDSLHIAVNLRNAGNIGTKPGAVLNFSGTAWTNESTASYPDEKSYINGNQNPTIFEGQGGNFVFRSLPNNLQSILLNGGYAYQHKKGAGFPNVTVSNTKDVFLAGNSDTYIRNKLTLDTGNIWLNNNNLIIGTTGKSGNIQGFDQNKYIITGEETNGGFLIVSNIGKNSEDFIFPVGATKNNYAPVKISYSGTPQEFKARIFNKILENAISGSALGETYIKTTWNVEREFYENAETKLSIQHPGDIEGSVFKAFKFNKSYVSRYNLQINTWDTLAPSTLIFPGTLTSGIPQDSSFENKIALVNSLNPVEFISKSVLLNNTIHPELKIAATIDNLTQQTNGQHVVKLKIVLSNIGQGALQDLKLICNLDNVFPQPIKFKILSLTSTGSLYSNPNYDGMQLGDSLLLLKRSSLDFQQSDSLYLVMELNNANKTGIFTITVFGDAVSTQIGIPTQTTSASVILNLSPIQLKIPEGFSPNEDGYNDRFVIANAINYDIYLKVYNRWESLVYDSKGIYQNDWNGKSNQTGNFLNAELPNGTYYYIITAKNKLTGDITILKNFITLKR